MMPLRDISNDLPVPSSTRSTNVNLRLPIEFAPTKKNDENASQPAFVRRSRGETNVDLWLDGGLYPKDPLVGCHPTFHTLPSLIKYVGEGEHGLLGYCKRLDSNHACALAWFRQQCQVLHTHSTHLQQQLHFIEKQVKDLKEEMKARETEVTKLQVTMKHLKDTPFGMRERKRVFFSIESLASNGGACKKWIMATRYFSKFIMLIAYINLHQFLTCFTL